MDKQIQVTQGRQSFVRVVAEEVVKWESPVLASVRIGQACLESNFGQSELALRANNYFGIKASYPWEGDTYSLKSREYIQGQWLEVTSEFRLYASIVDSCRDHAVFFQSTNWRKHYYAEVFKAAHPRGQAQALTGRYATDQHYHEKLLKIIENFDLTQYDGVKEMSQKQIIDRRSQALGGQKQDRSRQAIKRIVWHYTGVARGKHRFITDHESYWSKTLGWSRGGYHYYIDSQGQIYQNYNLERITWGVANNNADTVHISLEANHKNDYSPLQIASRDWLTRYLMKELGLKAHAVQGHWEVNNNTACPGYSREEMNRFRWELGQ